MLSFLSANFSEATFKAGTPYIICSRIFHGHQGENVEVSGGRSETRFIIAEAGEWILRVYNTILFTFI